MSHGEARARVVDSDDEEGERPARETWRQGDVQGQEGGVRGLGERPMSGAEEGLECSAAECHAGCWRGSQVT